MTFATTFLQPRIQYPEARISFHVIPLPWCLIFSWKCLTINSDFFGITSGCFTLASMVDLLILSPIRIVPCLSMKGSSLASGLALEMLCVLSRPSVLEFNALSSLSNSCSCTKLIISNSAAFISLTLTGWPGKVYSSAFSVFAKSLFHFLRTLCRSTRR